MARPMLREPPVTSARCPWRRTSVTGRPGGGNHAAAGIGEIEAGRWSRKSSSWHGWWRRRDSTADRGAETTLETMAPRARRGGEIEGLKGRIAEAFVESIFRRAGYRVSRADREGPAQRAVKVGADEFLPDFLLQKPAGATTAGRRLHRLIPVEVKYRASVEELLRSHGDELLARLAEQWPELCIVFVTDRPSSGRSCFQVLDVAAARSGAPLAAVDLHEVADLDIYLTTVQEYEALVHQIFPLLRLGGPFTHPSPASPEAPPAPDARDSTRRLADSR